MVKVFLPMISSSTKVQLRSSLNRARSEHGAVVVLHLSHRICDPNHKLCMDNYLMTYNVLEVLAEMKIHAAGTARAFCFTKPPQMDDKAMSIE